MRAPQHAVVLRRRRLRRKGHEAHAEFRQDQIQAHLHRSTPEFHHSRRKSIILSLQLHSTGFFFFFFRRKFAAFKLNICQ